MGVSVLASDDAAVATKLAVDVAAGGTREQLIAASLRRASSLLCPTTPGDLVASVVRALQPITEGGATLDAEVTETLDALVGVGDLVETIDAADGMRRRLIFLGSPRYVRRGSGDVVVVGVRPDATPLVGDELAARVENVGYLRKVAAATDLDGLLADYGLREIKAARWLRSPEPVEASRYVQLYDDRLTVQPPSGEIPDLRILDPAASVSYYRGRWRAAGPKDSSRFLARRSQGYGADLWCYVDLRAGEPTRMIDLPLLSSDRGCDEAWRLQAAIDAHRGRPEQISVRGTGGGRIRLGLHAPPPRWLQRRWDLFGRPARAQGALFAYDFAPKDLPEELAFAIDHLWLERAIAPKDDHT